MVCEKFDGDPNGVDYVTSNRILHDVWIRLKFYSQDGCQYRCPTGTVVIQSTGAFQVWGPLPQRNTRNADQKLTVHHVCIFNKRAISPIPYLFRIWQSERVYPVNSDLKYSFCVGSLPRMFMSTFLLNSMVTHRKTYILLSTKWCVVHVFLKGQKLRIRYKSEENMLFQTYGCLG